MKLAEEHNLTGENVFVVRLPGNFDYRGRADSLIQITHLHNPSIYPKQLRIQVLRKVLEKIGCTALFNDLFPVYETSTPFAYIAPGHEWLAVQDAGERQPPGERRKRMGERLGSRYSRKPSAKIITMAYGARKKIEEGGDHPDYWFGHLVLRRREMAQRPADETFKRASPQRAREIMRLLADSQVLQGDLFPELYPGIRHDD